VKGAIFCALWQTNYFAEVFQTNPSGYEMEEEEALIQLLETPTNSYYQSTVSKEMKFKKLSTAYIL
jgi:hypothetical protein